MLTYAKRKIWTTSSGGWKQTGRCRSRAPSQYQRHGKSRDPQWPPFDCFIRRRHWRQRCHQQQQRFHAGNLTMKTRLCETDGLSELYFWRNNIVNCDVCAQDMALPEMENVWFSDKWELMLHRAKGREPRCTVVAINVLPPTGWVVAKYFVSGNFQEWLEQTWCKFKFKPSATVKNSYSRTVTSSFNTTVLERIRHV